MPAPARSRAAAPRYRQVSDALRQSIREGALVPGDQLPTECELSRQFGVSRGTVIKAIDQLVGDGIVRKRQGAGSFVSLPALHRRSARLLSFTETLDLQGRTATQRVLSFGPAHDDRVRAFGAVGPAMELKRLRYVDGAACAIHTSLIPQRVVDDLLPSDMGRLLQGGESNVSLYAAFEAAGYVIDRGSEHVSARLASRAEAEVLNLRRPAALMVVVRQSFDDAGRLIEAAEAVYHADFYTYDLALVRGGDLSPPHRLRLATETG